MKNVKLAAATLNQTPLDWEGNLKRIHTALDMAREQDVSVLCLPEMCLTGYGCEDAFHSRGVQDTAIDMLQRVAPLTENLVVAVGVPVRYAGGLFNAACLLVDGTIAGFACKQHLAGDGIHYEPRWFKPWPEGIVGEITVGEVTCPMGDIIFDVGGVRIGFEICEDAWVADRTGARCSARGANIILNPSASHFSLGKHEVRKQFAVEGSRAFHVAYVYSNLLGNEAGRAIYDGDTLIALNGVLLADGDRFSYQPVSLVSATVDIESTRTSRIRSGSFEPELDGDESDVIRASFQFPECAPQSSARPETSSTDARTARFQEFTEVIALGLFDYLRKSRARGFVVSLSGGVDSTATVVLCAMMVRLAVRELGLTATCQRLGVAPCENVGDLTGQLLTTVYQSTRNSSETTRLAAAEVAQALSASHLELDVDDLVQTYTDKVSHLIGRPLNWEQDDLALQNIQARVRSPGVWMIANLKKALLLSTSNRSEIAVGYATMDGDTSGGLAPIAGIDKHFLRQWLGWMETDGLPATGPTPALNSVNVQQPTAELRPPESDQTDEDDLMPYEILDAVESYAIRDKLLPLDVHGHMVADYPEQSPEQLGKWIIRFYQLFCRNQWKRERFAPAFHVDDESLDPKTWCRFPILSSGFDVELRELAKRLQL